MAEVVQFHAARRTHLANLMRYMDGKVAAEESLENCLADPQLMVALKNRT